MASEEHPTIEQKCLLRALSFLCASPVRLAFVDRLEIDVGSNAGKRARSMPLGSILHVIDGSRGCPRNRVQSPYTGLAYGTLP